MTAPISTETEAHLSQTDCLRLLDVVAELSACRHQAEVIAVIRRVARELTRADGVTFVLRDVDKCFYAEENAIGPLWKGRRFPLTSCISGWCMLNKQTVSIEDIYKDPRIPHDAYRPTFVKSLVMTPVRESDPIAAIGNYWADNHTATPSEIALVRALANAVTIALENARMFEALEAQTRELNVLNAELETRVADRTREITAMNRELESFAYTVSHDLRAPVRAVKGFGEVVVEESGATMNAGGKDALKRVLAAADRMNEMIDGLLGLSQLGTGMLDATSVDASRIAEEILSTLRAEDPGRFVETHVEPGVIVRGDVRLIRAAFDNLLRNAWKYTGQTPSPKIEFKRASDGAIVVRDNGAGFDMKYAEKLFQPFQRLHTDKEFKGLGVGLATVKRITERHGGGIRAEGSPGQGAAFYITFAP